MFKASGAMTGPDQMDDSPVDATAADSNNNNTGKVASKEGKEADTAASVLPGEPGSGEESGEVDLSFLTDPSKRTVLDAFKRTEVVLFPKAALKALQDRIGGLKAETMEAKKEYGQLRKERVVLSKRRDVQNEKIGRLPLSSSLFLSLT